jgi:hypothetical protein
VEAISDAGPTPHWTRSRTDVDHLVVEEVVVDVQQERQAKKSECALSTGGLHQERNRAQRAPSARAGIPDHFHECAQTFSAANAESAMFIGDFETCDGSKNRRLRQCKISISEVLISVTLSLRGEVAEWPKAAVC